jgi:hypothetical protein
MQSRVSAQSPWRKHVSNSGICGVARGEITGVEAVCMSHLMSHYLNPRTNTSACIFPCAYTYRLRMYRKKPKPLRTNRNLTVFETRKICRSCIFTMSNPPRDSKLNPAALKSQVDNMFKASTAAVKSVQTAVKSEVSKRFVSTFANNVKSLKGEHFMSIAQLRYECLQHNFFQLCCSVFNFISAV